MDMPVKVNQLGANMWEQVIIVLTTFLDFMFSSKLIKAHNMVALLLGPWFKDLSLLVDYVGHFSTIKIDVVYDKEFFLPSYLEKFVLEAPWMVQYFFHCCARTMCNLDVVFGVGVYEE